MKTITMLEFRKNANKVIHWSKQGQRMIMTYRGQPAFRIEPICDEIPDEDDPFYKLDCLADIKGKNLSNQEMDKIIYEE